MHTAYIIGLQEKQELQMLFNGKNCEKLVSATQQFSSQQLVDLLIVASQEHAYAMIGYGKIFPLEEYGRRLILVREALIKAIGG